jgi:putative selenium metabolism hydrolase
MSLAKKILKLAEKYRDYTAENLSNLVKIRSLSKQEKDVNLKLKWQMQKAGFDEARIDGLGNTIGRIGNGGKILAIDAHIDTVAVGNPANWNFDPFSGEIREGFVHGRGTVDQKGGAASFVTAGRILKELGFKDGLTVYFTGTVMEEDCDGLCWKYLIEEEKIRPDYAISTEPTNMNVYRGQRGRMELEIYFRGVSAHGSAPERGKNAIYLASKACLEIEKLNNNLKGGDFLGKGSVTVSEFVSGSPSLCAVADFAKIHLDRRLAWGENKDSVIAELRKALEGLGAEIVVPYYEETAYTGLVYGMEKYYPTWKIEENHPYIQKGVEVYRDLFHSDPLIDKWTFSTNGVVINGVYGIPLLGFGPGNEELAHAPNEKVPIDDLVKASAFYALIACKLAGFEG